jgi:ArsR family transcriptional regulator
MSTRSRPGGCCDIVSEPVSLPTRERERLVAMFKALGDATRFDIFRLVAAQAEAICACDIVDRFAVSQPTISHHMRVLSDAGLITVSRRGVWAYYAADRRGLELLRQSLVAFAPSLLGVAD